jgi:hypothetical protein
MYTSLQLYMIFYILCLLVSSGMVAAIWIVKEGRRLNFRCGEQ